MGSFRTGSGGQPSFPARRVPCRPDPCAARRNVHAARHSACATGRNGCATGHSPRAGRHSVCAVRHNSRATRHNDCAGRHSARATRHSARAASTAAVPPRFDRRCPIFPVRLPDSAAGSLAPRCRCPISAADRHLAIGERHPLPRKTSRTLGNGAQTPRALPRPTPGYRSVDLEIPWRNAPRLAVEKGPRYSREDSTPGWVYLV